MTTENKKHHFEFATRLGYLPTSMFAKLDSEKAELIKSGVNVIDLCLGSPDLPSPEIVIEGCKEALKDTVNFRYPPFRGKMEFKEAASDWLKKRFSIDMNPRTEILSLSGSKEGIAHLAFAMINDGDYTIVPSPYYPVHARGTLLAGGNIYEIPMYAKDNYIMDLDSIPEDILKKAKMLFINYPNNPTGAVCDLSFFEKAVNVCKKHNILLVSDMAYSELTFDDYVAPSIFEIDGAKDIAIEFHTFSKTYSMAGWRIAFAIGSEEVIDALYAVKTNTDYGVCNITQAASIKAFSIPLSEHKKTSKIYEERRDVLISGLNKLGWNIQPPKGGMFVWAPIPKEYSCGIDFSSNLLQKAHIATIPGAAFGTEGEKYVRFALVEPIERLQEALNRIEKTDIRFS